MWRIIIQYTCTCVQSGAARRRAPPNVTRYCACAIRIHVATWVFKLGVARLAKSASPTQCVRIASLTPTQWQLIACIIMYVNIRIYVRAYVRQVRTSASNRAAMHPGQTAHARTSFEFCSDSVTHCAIAFLALQSLQLCFFPDVVNKGIYPMAALMLQCCT